MKFYYLPHITLLVFLSFVATSCGRSEREAQGPAVESVESAEGQSLEAPAPEMETVVENETNTDELPPAEPSFSVALVGDTIEVSGALRSPIQQKRIIETLTAAFPDHKIESDLKVEYHRFPVGWGNRIADEYLVYFLRGVKDARVSYEDSVVTLEGTVKNERALRQYTEMTIDVFSGATTSDIVNKLKVEEGAEAAKEDAKPAKESAKSE